MYTEVARLQRNLSLYARLCGRTDAVVQNAMASVNQRILGEYHLARLRAVCRAAPRSSFWRKKLGSVGRIRELQDIERIPITSRAEIDEITDSGRLDELIARARHQKMHRITSGGIGHKAKFVSVMTSKEYRFHLADIIRMFLANGIDPSSSMVSTLPGRYVKPKWVADMIREMHGNLSEYVGDHVAGTVLCDAAKLFGLRFISTGLPLAAYKVSQQLAEQESERLMMVIERERPQILATSPNLLTNSILPCMMRKEAAFARLGVNKIIVAGSALSPQIVHSIRSQGTDVISWVESGEVCTIAYSTGTAGGHRRLVPTHFTNFFEIVDEDGKPVPINQKGRVIATRLATTAQPLIRFDLEDEAYFVRHLGRILFDCRYGRAGKGSTFPLIS